jgi:hypothetical protein
MVATPGNARFSLFLVIAALGCEPTAPPPAGTSDAGASPNAKILPAPLATEAPELADGGLPADDAGAWPGPADTAPRADGGAPLPPAPPPETMRPGTPLAAEGVPYLRDAPGVTLDAVLRWRDVPAPPKAPEVSGDGLREAQKLTALALKIDLTDAGRMRAELASRAFPFPPRTEIRARSDHLGSLLLWPDGAEYRVVPPGALRPLLGERRVDVTPLSPGAVRLQGEGRRLGFGARKVEITSSVATVRLEMGRVSESGEGGMVLCRVLVELGGVDPRTPLCQPGEVPLAASYAWQEGGGIGFEVTALTKRSDLPAANLLVPPPGASFVPAGLPSIEHGIFLTREEIAAFRTAPITLPPSRAPGTPGEGFVAVDQADRAMILLLDGVPVVEVPAHGEQYVAGPVRGRYVAQWRSFLGEKVGPAQTVEMPARLVYGSAPDAGAPDGGF